jgi:general secretion pathway protein B
MSILLDALKKSEAQRRLGEAPTLESPAFSPETRGLRDRSWIPVVMSLSAAAMILWFGLVQFREAGEPSGQPSHVSIAQTDDAISEIDDSRESLADAGAPTATTPLKNYRESQSRVTGENIRRSARDKAIQSGKTQDLPLKTFSRETPGSVADNKPSGVESSGKSAAATDPYAELQTQVQDARHNVPEPYSIGPLSAGTPNAGTANPASAGDELEPYMTEPISYWQLPQSVRDSLGELRVSVLVYAENPQDRFLLVNGQRLREQESLDDGLLLLEIQRDRAIFSYRDYRFQLKS